MASGSEKSGDLANVVFFLNIVFRSKADERYCRLFMGCYIGDDCISDAARLYGLGNRADTGKELHQCCD